MLKKLNPVIVAGDTLALLELAMILRLWEQKLPV